VQEDINQIIEKNLGLVYSQLKRFGLLYDPEAESLAYEALYKAIKGFDDSRTNTFATYAIVCIYNALGCYIRQLNRVKQLEVFSYNSTTTDEEGDSKELLDFISSTESVEQELVAKDRSQLVQQVLKEVYQNLTNDKHKKLVVYWIQSGYTASTVLLAKQAGVSQSYACQVIQRFKSNIKKRLEAADSD
jgi:RNA polymerase sigma factor (sigma-70 family)